MQSKGKNRKARRGGAKVEIDPATRGQGGPDRRSSLELGLIGNCCISALVDACGKICWSCWPRFDADPVFSDLLNDVGDNDETRRGFFDVVLDGLTRAEQSYLPNTAVLSTRLFDREGNGLEIFDFAPRFRQYGRTFRPTTLVRILRPLAGAPRIRIRLRPTFDYNTIAPQITHGSNHIRYVGQDRSMRLTTDAAPSYLLNEAWFCLEAPLSMHLGPDEVLTRGVGEAARDYLDETAAYWQEWVRQLYLPLEWQDAVIRAAITLKLCSFEETGAIVAAMTTSVPEAHDSGRNWDYRFCWLRDAFFVVRALNRLGAVGTMENFLQYLTNVIAGADGKHLQPVYGISLEGKLTERIEDKLAGFRGMGPVRVGNQAFEHLQHDVYGDVILAVTQAFFDRRLRRQPDQLAFRRLEAAGERAYRLHDKPDAGMWELRTRARVHTSSSLMCWAACDRLAKIALHIGRPDRGRLWRRRADHIRETINRRAWNAKLRSYVDSFEGGDIDAGLLLMVEVGFLQPTDKRFKSTVRAIEKRLKKGKHLMRYHAPDDFGVPETAFNICTLWYVEALDMMGRKEEARDIFENILSLRTDLGLLSEDLDIDTGELWGNFPQSYSMVGIINCAMRLSRPWSDVL